MRSSLKSQLLKLKNKKRAQSEPGDKKELFKMKSTKKSHKKASTDSKNQKELFKGLSFCFPHSDIELTDKQIELMSRQIEQRGGIIIDFKDHLKNAIVEYVLVSTKVRITNVIKKIEGKLNYLAVLDYNFVECCIGAGEFLDAANFELSGLEVPKQQEPSKREDFLGRKKIKVNPEIPEEESRSLTEQIPSDEIQSDQGEKTEQKKKRQLDKNTFFCQKGKDDDRPALNKFIEKQLLDLQKIYANERDLGRKIAYGKAASTIRTWKEQIVTEADAEKIPGIGPKILKKIKEIISTGKLRKLDELNQSQENIALRELTRVWGVGPAKAKQLYKSGIRNLDQLRQHKNLLTKNQLIGLNYVEDFESRIPREKVTKLFEYVRDTLKEITKDPELYQAQVCGSYRRGKASCGDMDVIITKKDGVFEKDLLVNLVKQLNEKKFITDNLSEPKNTEGHVSTSYMGVCQLGDETHHRIDIKHYPLEGYAFAMLYFTGSGMFNRSMRLYANKLGLQLSDKGFEKRPKKKEKDPQWRKPIPTCFTEEEIFKVLGLDFRTPKQRDD